MVVESRLARTGSLGPLSESIIPAIPGKYYAYSTVFTDDEPLYALLDCKANKSRTLAQATDLGHEVHLRFEFDDAACAGVSSIKSAQSAGLLGPAYVQFDDVWVAPSGVAIEDFYNICARRDSEKLMDTCKAACHEHKESTSLARGAVIAVMTSAGKYGLFLVKDITPTSVSVDACHVLSP